MNILDNHMHLSPSGRGLEAVKDFRIAGGTHVIISHMPYKEAPVRKVGDYAAQYDITVKMVDKVNSQMAVTAYATLGPYPADLCHLVRGGMPLEEAKAILIDGMELAAEYVREGKAIALGEIGRPHFPVSDEVMDASNEILCRGLELAKEIGCAAVLHVEGGGKEVYASLVALADKVGIDKGKVVRHFSGPVVDEKENHGLFPSVLARKGAVEKAIQTSSRFMMETDYIDDLTRPGAVLGPATVPKRTMTLLGKGILTNEDCAAIHTDNPARVYGIDF
jgi:TatD-related deoxyribonuclease